MNYPDYKYIDTALGNVNKRNNVKEIVNLNGYEGKTDCYRTVFRFASEYLEYFNKNNTVAGFKGKSYADFIPIDIDSEELLSAYNKCKYCIQLLEVDYSYKVEYLFFSGKKGFHILLPSECFGIFEPSENLPQIFKNIMKDIYEECDLSIYDINRLFRLNNTKHSGSNLFKIAITLNEFNQGMEHILILAKAIRKPQYFPFSDNVKNSQLVELYQKYKNFKSTQIIKDTSLYKDFKGVQKGTRDTTATRICGILKSKGMESELVYEILTGWNIQNKPPLEDKDLQKIISSVYRYDNGKNELTKQIIPAIK